MPPRMHGKVRQQVSNLWEADLSLTLTLVFLVLLLFIVIPLSGVGQISGMAELLIAGTFSLLGVSGVFAVTGTRGARIAGLVAVTAPIALGWYEALAHKESLTVLRGTLMLVALGWMAVITLLHVLRAGPVTIARLQGAVAVYLLASLVFSELYFLALHANPGALQFSHPPASRIELQSQLTYFSLTTLTTLGYGDIVPASNATRSLATLESLMGQLYPAILIGRLVSLHVSRAEKNRPQPPEQP